MGSGYMQQNPNKLSNQCQKHDGIYRLYIGTNLSMDEEQWV